MVPWGGRKARGIRCGSCGPLSWAGQYLDSMCPAKPSKALRGPHSESQSERARRRPQSSSLFPGALPRAQLPDLLSSEVGHLVLLGRRAPFTLSTHLSLSKVLGHCCHIRRGPAGLSAVCTPALPAEAPPRPPTPWCGAWEVWSPHGTESCSGFAYGTGCQSGGGEEGGARPQAQVLMAEPCPFPVSRSSCDSLPEDHRS